MDNFNLCIIKPNKDAFSETFVQEHINRLPGNKKVLWGGAFPLYDDEGSYLIRSPFGLLSYLFQKRILKSKDIKVRTNALVRYLKEQKIDVVFAEYGTVGSMVTDACQIANVPLVIHYHGADVHHHKTVEAYLPYYKKAFAYASAFIAVSKDMVAELIKLGAPADKIHLASCGVDVAKFPQLDISKTKKEFLSIGRFVEKKSPKSVIDAFKIVVDKHYDARLTMVGQGPLFEEAHAEIERVGLQHAIKLTGVLKTDEIKKLLGKARVFVQHSVTAKDGDMEGTPVTILEAGASGLAIVSTRHAGIKEAVIDGETGYLVDEHDIAGMADYMIKFAEDIDLAVQMGAKETEHIRRNYDINDRIKTLTAILKQAIKEK